MSSKNSFSRYVGLHEYCRVNDSHRIMHYENQCFNFVHRANFHGQLNELIALGDEIFYAWAVDSQAICSRVSEHLLMCFLLRFEVP